MTRRGPLALAVAVALVAGGCGLPSDDGPDAIAIPAELAARLEDPDPSAADDVPTDPSFHAIYLLDGDRLVKRLRALTPPVPLKEPIESLLEPLTAEDADFGTAIPLGTVVNSVALTSGADEQIVTVDLDGSFFLVEGEQRIRATAQLVYTATALVQGGADGVVFTNNGEPRVMPRGDGTQPVVGPGQPVPPLRTRDFFTLAPIEERASLTPPPFAEIDIGTLSPAGGPDS